MSVQIFSALYKMLPSSKNYLMKGGFSDEKAAWILLGCFSAGFIGIQVLLRHGLPLRSLQLASANCPQNHSSMDAQSRCRL